MTSQLPGGHMSGDRYGQETGVRDDYNGHEKNQCRYLVLENGDRIFPMTQDYEMSFIIPLSKMDTVLEGLAKTHKAGIRYPITSFFDFQPTFPPSYQEQMKVWEQGGKF
jgi:hypothetical protein